MNFGIDLIKQMMQPALSLNRDLPGFRLLVTKTRKIILVIILCFWFQSQISAAEQTTRPNEQGPWPSVQVNTYTGNLFHQRNDLNIPSLGEIQMDVYFSYNSLKHQHDKGYGNGWTFSFGMYYKLLESNILIFREEGEEDLFTYDGVNYIPPVGIYDQLTQYAPGKFLLRTKNGISYYFEDANHKHLTKITDRNNNSTTLSYTDGKLTTITEPAGRMLNLTWVDDHLTQITDPNTTPSRVIVFNYSSEWYLVQVIRPTGNSWSYSYDLNGNMISLTDPRANTVTVTYDVNEAVTGINCSPVSYSKTFTYDNCSNTTTVSQVVSTANRQTVYTFDLTGRVLQKKFPDGNSVSYAWDSQNNLTTFTSEIAGNTSFTYDTKGNLLSETDCLGFTEYYTYESTYNKMTSYQDKNGNLTGYGYDPSGNLVRISDCFNNSEWFTYDSFGNRITDKDKNNNTTTYTYDIYGNRNGLIDPLLFTETRTFDLVGNLLSVTDKRGYTSTFTYDPLDRNILITDAMGYTRSFSWDGNGNLLSETNKNGHTTWFSYDAANRLIMTLDANGGIFTMVYDEAGNIISEINANGFTTLQTYNNRDWRVGITDCLGNLQSFTYNAAGFMLSSTDKGGNTTNYAYDCLGQLTLKTDPNGFTESFIYDPAGNRISYTDKNLVTTTSSFDCLNRLSVINYPLGYTEIFGYDAEDNRTALTDKNGNTTTYSYDPLGRVLTVTDPMSITETRTYDGAGNISSSTDKNGNTTTYSYDPIGRLIIKTDPVPFGYTEIYTYDGMGNLLTSTDRRGNTTSNLYDNLSRRISTTTPMGYTETTSYDAMGNITAFTNKNGFTTTYVYDCLGQKTSTTDPMSFSESFTYDPNGHMISFTDKNNATTTWNYSCCRLMSETDPLLFTEYYGYDNNGNRTSVTNKNGDVTIYAFDLLDRMTGLTTPLGHQTLYTLDGNANVLTRTDPNLNTTGYTYNARGELINTLYPDATSITYSYDNNGSLLQTVNTGGIGETITYSIDGLGRVTSQVTNFGAFTKTLNYSYDQNGNNLATTSESGTISYIYDTDNRVIQITDQNGGVTTFQYDGMGHKTAVNYPNDISTFYTYDANGNVTSVITQTTPSLPPPSGMPGHQDIKVKHEIPAETLEGVDYAIVEILAPVSGPGLGDAEPVIVSVMNFGTIVLPFFTLSYTLDETLFTEDVMVPIPPMGVHIHIFSQPADLSEPGHTYMLTACAMAPGDTDPTNDCLTTLVENMLIMDTYQAFYYEYNPNGLKTWEGHMDGSYVSYSYNTRNELLSEYTFPTGNLTGYAYTPTGQRASATINGLISNYFYDDDDVLIYTSEESYTLNNNGNRIAMNDLFGNMTEYTYGFENELRGIDLPDGTGSQYYYSALGSLLAAYEGGIITYYHSSGGEVLEEFNAAGMLSCYYNPGVSVSQGSMTGYYYYDRFGTATLQMDPAQTILATASFDEFGNTTASSGSWLNNIVLFRTEEIEPNIGFINLDNGLFYDFTTNSLPAQCNYVAGEGVYTTSWFWNWPYTETIEEYLSGITKSTVGTAVATVKHCCCCVKDLRTPRNMVKNNKPGGPYTIRFDTEIDLEYKLWDQNFDGDCTFEWWEKSPNPPEWQHVPANTWNNMTQVPATAPSFNHSWNCRKKPCPGTETVVDTDEPGFNWYGRAFSGSLNVMFEITVKSTPNCDCTILSISRFFETNFEIKNGKPTRDEPEFIDGLPPDQIRPR